MITIYSNSVVTRAKFINLGMEVVCMSNLLKRATATAALLSMLAPYALGATRRRAVMPPVPPTAVIAAEATATNYGTTPLNLEQCIDTACSADQLAPGQTKLYQNPGSVLRIRQTGPGSLDVQSDGITFPGTTYGTKTVPGIPDTSAWKQEVCLVADRAGATTLTEIAATGTTQQLDNIAYHAGVTCVTPSTLNPNVGNNWTYQVTDALGVFTKWTNNSTKRTITIPAATSTITQAYNPQVDSSSIVVVHNPATVTQGANLVLWSNGQRYGRGTDPILAFGSTSITNVPAFLSTTGTGSFSLSGAPQGQDLEQVQAWLIDPNMGNQPLLSYNQAATAHGTNPGNNIPYQNTRWNGLRTDSTHHTLLRLQNLSSAAITGNITLDDQGTTFATVPVSMTANGSSLLILDQNVGTHTLYNATLQLDESTTSNDPRATGTALVSYANGFNARAPVVITRAAPASQYELKTQLFIVDDKGNLLETEGTTTNQNLMQIIYNSTTLDPFVGTKVYGNLTPAYQSLQDTVNRIQANFTPANYREVFNAADTDVKYFFQDTDGEGLCIDVLPNGQDWQYDNNTAHPGNNAHGVYSIQLTLTKK